MSELMKLIREGMPKERKSDEFVALNTGRRCNYGEEHISLYAINNADVLAGIADDFKHIKALFHDFAGMKLTDSLGAMEAVLNRAATGTSGDWYTLHLKDDMLIISKSIDMGKGYICCDVVELPATWMGGKCFMNGNILPGAVDAISLKEDEVLSFLELSRIGKTEKDLIEDYQAVVNVIEQFNLTYSTDLRDRYSLRITYTEPLRY